MYLLLISSFKKEVGEKHNPFPNLNIRFQYLIVIICIYKNNDKLVRSTDVVNARVGFRVQTCC